LNGQIELIEEHDAIVSEVVVPARAEANIVFSSLAAYYRAGDEEYSIFTHRARLGCAVVTSLILQGALREDDYVSEGTIRDGDGETLEWVDLLQTHSVESVTLQFGSGTRMEIRCGTAELALEGRGEFLEHWKGPLGS
jgi:hypothetical protein